MDYFHRQACKRKMVGPGGVRCVCCNPMGRRARLNRAVRRTVRQEDRALLRRIREGKED